MRREFAMPDVGEGLTEAEVVTWNVAPGDTVTVNQIICEIETAKAAVELPSPFAGTVGELLAKPGETVAVGSPDHRDRDGRAGRGARSRAAAERGRRRGWREDRRGRQGRPDRHAGRLRPAPRLGHPPPPPRGAAAAAVPRARQRRSRLRPPRRPARLRPPLPQQGAPPVRPSRGRGPLRSQPQQGGAGRPVVRRGPSTTPGPPAAPAGDCAAGQAAGAQARPRPGRRPARGHPVRADGVITREDVQAHANGTAPARPSRGACPGRGIRRGERREPIRGVRKATAAAMVSSAFTAPHVTEFLPSTSPRRWRCATGCAPPASTPR